jgi:hypothetical protein
LILDFAGSNNVPRSISPYTALLSICALAGCHPASQLGSEIQPPPSPIAHHQPHDRNSYLGQTPPEIVSEPEHWAGMAPPPLAQLKGKVVWLHFNY